MNNENPSFFDARTIIAIVLVAATFLGWQYYMQTKYPEAFKQKTAVSEETKTPADTAKPEQAKAESAAASALKSAPEAPLQTSREEKLIHFESESLSFDLSSKGMGLRDLTVRNFTDRAGKAVHLGHPDENSLPLETRLLGRPEALDFDIRKVNDNLFVGRAQIGELEVTKTLEVIPDKYVFNTKLSVQGSDDRFVGLTTVLAEKVEPVSGGSFLMPQFEKQEFYIESADTHERVIFDEEDAQHSWNKIKVASVGSQYFTQAVVDKSPIMPEAKARLDHKGKIAEILLQYPVLNKGGAFQLEYTAFMGPKSHHLLTSVDSNLAKVVDFGFFNWIGRQILSLLRWFYGLIGNWGVAIILLTVVVRVLVLPFNLYSYKSMKAMQAIQPKIQAAREKYKDDQQKQQQEIMGLMREHKVNPIGGCLPVFLQFPIFIALYQVLGNSIELYQAPFGLWIHDLSLKDPYYVLPVLMGITMFIQQKITPNTMDPAQAKILLMMPLIFTIFMVALPSGLTLYMLVGAIFGVLQQLYFMRDSNSLQKSA